MRSPITDDHLHEYRTRGYCLVPDLVDADDLARVRRAVAAIAPSPEAFAADPDPRKDAWRVHDFPYGDDVLDRAVSMRPDVLRFVERAIGSQDLAMVTSQVVVKYHGHDNARFEQALHQDWPNNTLVVPREDGGYAELSLIVYYTDVLLETGPTFVVPDDEVPPSAHGKPWVPSEQCPELYARERPVLCRAGTGLFYKLTTFHRGSAPSARSGVRIHQTHTFRDAAHRWMDFIAWPRRGSPALDRFITVATPRERSLIGFPAPGHPYWNAATLAGVAQRYHGIDMAPYVAAAGVAASAAAR